MAELTAGVRRIVDRLSVGDDTVTRPPAADVLLAGGLLIAAVGTYLWQPTPGIPLLSPRGVLAFLLLAIAFGALAWRRVVPTTTILVSGVSTGVWFFVGHTEGFIPLAAMIALYSVAAYGGRADAVLSLVVAELFVIASFAVILLRDETFSAIQLVINVLLFLGLWALGDRTRVRRELVGQLRARADQAERSRELATELAVAEERSRIARELHDVVAHTVSVMVVQAGAARRVLARDPQGADGALGAIEQVGREALTDLRRMVGVLREESAEGELAPQPTLSELPTLVERLAAAGLPVDLLTEGDERPLSSGIEVTGYRLVQEALTNVMKHAGSVRRVVVRLRYGEGAIAIEVEDDGRGAASLPETSGAGSGVPGMRERVAVYGGTLRVGPRPDGGFRVRAVLPLPVEGPMEGHPVEDATARDRPARRPQADDRDGDDGTGENRTGEYGTGRTGERG